MKNNTTLVLVSIAFQVYDIDVASPVYIARAAG